MRHIFFIDPLENLNIKKDSTLMMALSFLERGETCYLLFEKDFSIKNIGNDRLTVYEFSGTFKNESFYLDTFLLGNSSVVSLEKSDVIHMRIDPPYDSRYQRYLWMLDFLRERVGLEVLNHPLKIMKHNEKLVAIKRREFSHASFVGSSEREFLDFVGELEKMGFDEVILKPLDLYSGIGVEKAAIDSELVSKFSLKVGEFHGAIVCQPFIKEVYAGEYRSIYFDGDEIGTILKTPNKGEFLANIAQGAAFKATPLDGELKLLCDTVAKELLEDDVRFIAFDLLGGKINEVNITCPGLLVEVSHAYNENLANLILDRFISNGPSKRD